MAGSTSTVAVKIIAEAGVNHNGQEELALKLVDVAAESGADTVKFQTFIPELVATNNAPKADYQVAATGESDAQLEMIKKLWLEEDSFFRIKKRCEQNSIEFLSSPFDLPSLRFLHTNLGLQTLKIPSGEITHGPLLLAAARTGCDIILSTGMSTLDEVRVALAVLAFGFCGSDADQPTAEAFDAAFNSVQGQDLLRAKVSLLHCTTEYPAPFDEVNLKAMDALRETFNLKVGYSDHTEGTLVSVMAIARGANIIEKHFTLNKSMAGPDHKASLDPGELGRLIREIRLAETTLGNGLKTPTPSEQKNIPIARKSLVAARNVKSGEILNEHNVVAKRPGTGITPMKYWEMLGQVATKDYKKDDIFDA